ncbi:MAG: DUF4136 domain-containing protein [Bacteroidota bacterium]
MKNAENIGMMLMSLALLAGCAITDVDRTTDFGRYRTFAWGESEVEVDNSSYSSEMIHRHLKAAIENEFAKRGIMPVQRKPDFLVSYHTYTEKKEQVSAVSHPPYYFNPFYPFYYYSFRYSPFGWYVPYTWVSAPHTTVYTEGTLVIDITDRKTKELVWRGMVSGNVNRGDLEKQLNKAVKAIMKKYPVEKVEPALGRAPAGGI